MEAGATETISGDRRNNEVEGTKVLATRTEEGPRRHKRSTEGQRVIIMDDACFACVWSPRGLLPTQATMRSRGGQLLAGSIWSIASDVPDPKSKSKRPPRIMMCTREFTEGTR